MMHRHDNCLKLDVTLQRRQYVWQMPSRERQDLETRCNWKAAAQSLPPRRDRKGQLITHELRAKNVMY